MMTFARKSRFASWRNEDGTFLSSQILENGKVALADLARMPSGESRVVVAFKTLTQKTQGSAKEHPIGFALMSEADRGDAPGSLTTRLKSPQQFRRSDARVKEGI